MTFLSSKSFFGDFASRTARSLVATAALLGLAGAPAFAQPFTINPAQTDANDVVGSQNPVGSADFSFGYFFEITGSGYSANALAISAQNNVAWTNPYTVYLYEFDQTANPTVYSELAQLTFTPGDPNLIPRDDNNDGFIDNYWLELSPAVDLKPNPYGYAIAAAGDFNDPSGNFIESGGTITFNPAVSYLGNGYNDANDVDYPIPVFVAYTIPGDDTSPPISGYWNPNLSIVPGPLPVLGGAVAFGWTRRLRRRIRVSASSKPTA